MKRNEKLKLHPSTQSPRQKLKFCSYFVENNQKARLNLLQIKIFSETY